MTAVPVLSRRNVGCVSDLTIDRWLLGETPGSDEARRVEEHMKTCANCASRIGALRGLYATQVPAARHEPPVRLDALPAQAPGQTGALQFVILRDGLLVGTEFFTPGAYLIGSDPRADLQLDGVLPLHARLYFRDGRVAVKAAEGALYVNGFKVDSCEVRSIDEVLVGPYVLRSRVIRERWSDLPRHEQRAPVEPIEESVTAKIELPPATTRLTVELWWGDTRQEAKSFEGDVTAKDFPLWGFTVADDFVLAERLEGGRFLLHPPAAAARAQKLEPGARVTLTEGAMQLVVSVDPLVEKLPAAPLVSWPTAVLSAVLLAALFIAMAFVPVPDEDRFTPRDLKLSVTLLPPKPKPKPADPVDKPDRSTVRREAEVRADDRRRSTPPPPRPAIPADRFSAVNKLLSGNKLKSLLDAKPAGKANAGHPTNLLAGIGVGAGAAKGLELGITGDGGPGIGAGGLKKGGLMSGGGYGKGRVGGLVDRPRSSGIGVTGGVKCTIDRDGVAKAIADHLAEVSACYEKALITNGRAGGRLSLEWTITTAGTVAQAKVKSSTLKDGSIASCVMAHLKTWRFPRARGGSVVVSYPFVFQSSDF